MGGGLGVHLLLHQRGQHPAGADGVGGDAGGGGLQRRHLGQPHDAVLGGHIGRLLRRPHQAMHRSHVDDAAPVGAAHGGQGQARGVEGAGQVDGDDGVPALDGKIFHIGHMLDTRVVHQNVHLAKLRLAVAHHVFDVCGATHVGPVVRHLCPAGLAGGQHFSAGGVHIAKAVEHNVGPLARQRFCNAQTNAAGRAGDEGRFAFQHESLSVMSMTCAAWGPDTPWQGKSFGCILICASPNELRCNAAIIKRCSRISYP